VLSSDGAPREASAAERARPVLDIEVLSFDRIDALAPQARTKYLMDLLAAELDAGIDERDSAYAAYSRWENRCAHTVDPRTGRRCSRQKWEGKLHCARHLDIAEIDPRSEVDRRADAAKLRLAEMLEKSVDQLEGILNSDPDAISPAVMLKAVEMTFDRSGVPKLSSSDVNVTAEISHQVDAAGIVQSRLDALAASAQAMVVEGSVVETEEDQ
jgi:hypothetical protein